MRHYHTSDVTSIMLHNKPSLALQEEICRELVDAVMGWDKERSNVPLSGRVAWYEHTRRFIFLGNAHPQGRSSGQILAKSLAPAEFRALVDAKRWYSKMDRDMTYRAPKFWTRTGDFVYVNINTGKCVAFVDAHYW